MVVVVIGVMWAFGILGFFGFEITVLTALIPPIVIVIGVENEPEAQVFVEKSEHAIRNMQTLIKKGILDSADTNIYKFYQRFKSLGFLWFFRVLLKYFRKKAIEGSLFYFNLYRLSYLSRLLKDSQ